MKLITLLFLFVALVAAQQQFPHHNVARSPKIVTNYEFVTTTATIEDVVYVDQDGHTLNGTPLPTTIQTVLISEPTVTGFFSLATNDASAAVKDNTETFASPGKSSLISRAVAPTAAVKDAAAQAQIQPQSSADNKYRAYGISYAPRYADNSCKDAGAVNSDVAQMTRYGYVRSYGTDCDQAYTVLNAAKNNGMKAMLGIWDLTNVGGNAQQIIDAVNRLNDNWASVISIGVGNEHVNSGMADVGTVVGAANNARNILRNAGYRGPVVVVDTFNQIINHPELCHASDYAAANCHGFFNAGLSAQDAGSYVLDMARQVSQVCGGMRTVITESGWPKGGNANGNAVPSVENQRKAIASLISHFDTDLILFSAFDDKWKSDNQYTFAAEKFWGIEM